MATNPNQQTSSVQRKETPRPDKFSHILPNGDFTEEDINKKSTVDRRKRRIAHIPKFPRNVKENPIILKLANKPEPKIISKRKQVQNSNTQLCKVAIFNENNAKHGQTANTKHDRTPARKRRAIDDGNEVKNKKSKSRENKLRK